MSTTPDPGFVYLARVRRTSMYKIGVSSDPARRVSDFGPPCELVHALETGHARSIKADLLERFSDHMTNGEWMDCPDSVPPEIVNEMDRLKEDSPTPSSTSEEENSPEPLPPLSDGGAFTFSQIQRHAHRLTQKSLDTHAEIASVLDVTENAVAKAVTTAGPRLQRLQMRIVELLSEYEVERREHVEFRTWRKDRDRDK